MVPNLVTLHAFEWYEGEFLLLLLLLGNDLEPECLEGLDFLQVDVHMQPLTPGPREFRDLRSQEPAGYTGTKFVLPRNWKLLSKRSA